MRIVMFLVSPTKMPGIKVVNHVQITAEVGKDALKEVFPKEAEGFDVAFIQYQRDEQIPFEAIDNIPKGVIKLAWNGDVRNEIFDWQIELAKHVDIMSFISGTDVKAVLPYKKHTYWFDLWYHEESFYPTNVEKDIDIVFMANTYTTFPLSDYRREVVRFIKKKYKEKSKVYGNGWGELSDGDSNSSFSDQAEVYNRSKIAINISNFEHERYASDRILRAMGSGCFVLSHWYPKMPFKNHKHLALFRDLTDLEYKISYFLNNETRREQIAKEGQKFVKAGWSRRCTKGRIEDIIRQYKNT